LQVIDTIVAVDVHAAVVIDVIFIVVDLLLREFQLLLLLLLQYWILLRDIQFTHVQCSEVQL
jgi:hypothetical protein